MKTLMFDHEDLDAAGCGIVANIYLGIRDIEKVYCSYDTINKEIVERIPEFDNYDLILITDISVNKHVAEFLDQYKEKVVLLDHHETALWLNKYEWGTVMLKDVTNTNVCGTSMLLHYFESMDHIIPNDQKVILEQFVEIVRLYDTWDWKKKNNSEPCNLNTIFQTIGINTFVGTYTAQIGYSAGRTTEFTLTPEHGTLLYYKLQEVENYIVSKLPYVKTFHDEFDNIVAFVVADNHISAVCDRILDNYDCDYVCCYTGSTMSLRSRENTVNVGEIAKKYGGGGRECTAGMNPVKFYINKYLLQY